MPLERLAPDAILNQTNLVGTLAAVQNDPDASDGTWLTATDSSSATILRVSFPTPSAAITGTQEFRARVRRVGGTDNPPVNLELWINGVSTLVGPNTTVANTTTGEIISWTWDAGAYNGASVECRVNSPSTGGKPATRATCEVEAVEWNANVQAVVTTINVTGSDPIQASISESQAFGIVSVSSSDTVATSAVESTAFGPVIVSASDSVSLGISEAVSFGTVTVSASDQGSLSLVDSGVTAGSAEIVASESITASVDESSVIDGALDATEAISISVADTSSVINLTPIDKSASDTAGISITDTSSLNQDFAEFVPKTYLRIVSYA